MPRDDIITAAAHVRRRYGSYIEDLLDGAPQNASPIIFTHISVD